MCRFNYTVDETLHGFRFDRLERDAYIRGCFAAYLGGDQVSHHSNGLEGFLPGRELAFEAAARITMRIF